MALEYPEKKLFGVQFHPESIMTKEGKTILQNFILLAKS
jgi:anthranilate/para-aminobenzoate synthase component II